VRKLSLAISATMLQDDSGIPLGHFEAKKWRLEACGHYAGPIPMFASFYQPRMAELYLLLAQKGLPPSSEVELTPCSQAEMNATGTAAPSPKKTRKRVETEATRSLGCRIARVFPLCW
jgi:hypothetical protein